MLNPKYILCVIASLALVDGVNGQDKKQKQTEAKKVETPAEEMPEFPGGESEMLKFIETKLEYPETAITMAHEGVVHVKFVVKKNGTLADVKVLRSVDPQIDAEALRVVSMMPKWSPGKQKGKPANVNFILPIRFEIPADKRMPEVGTVNLSEEVIFSEESAIVEGERDENYIYSLVDTQPEYPGGNGALSTFIKETMQYPKRAIKDGVEGTCFVEFVVNRDGTLSDFKILKGISDALDHEAMRILSNSPKWKPGSQKGKIVRVKYVLPVRFKLPESK